MGKFAGPDAGTREKLKKDMQQASVSQWMGVQGKGVLDLPVCFVWACHDLFVVNSSVMDVMGNKGGMTLEGVRMRLARHWS